LPNVGTHASSASVKGNPQSRSISGVPTGVPVMTWIVQQHDQTKASITLALDFFVMILVVNNFVSSKSNQKQMKAD
jgi:phosphoribosylcarboxyaminoimidazole (NCAIR) mutase